MSDQKAYRKTIGIPEILITGIMIFFSFFMVFLGALFYNTKKLS